MTTINALLTRSLGVLLQVIGTPVCTPHALYPPIGSEALSIPAVTGIVSHLIAEVLPEPELLGVDANPQEILLDACHVVAKSLVGHQALECQKI